MKMTLLNFETSFRPEKVQKARGIFLRDHVIELDRAKTVWIGRIRVGYYKVQVWLNGIKIERSTCPCDSRSKSRHCEHKLAVFFALRKKLDLYPALTNSSPKLTSTGTGMSTHLREMDCSEEPLRKKDIKLFTDTCKKLLREAGKNIPSGKYCPGLGDCFEVVRLLPEMSMMLGWDYPGEELLTDQAFDLLSQAVEQLRDEELLEQFAHDLRVETLRNFENSRYKFGRWMELLKTISNSGNRLEKFNKVLATLDRIERSFPASKNY